MTSTWVGVVLFAALFAVGLAVMLGGFFVVVRALTAKPPAPVARQVPVAAPPPVPQAPAAPPARLDALTPGATPRADEWQDDVPTAVFRPSDYKDIEALMHDADKYVSKHKS